LDTSAGTARSWLPWRSRGGLYLLVWLVGAQQPAERIGPRPELADARQVVQQQLAVVADRQVLQLERPDAILGRERRLGDLFHRELVGLVRHVVRARRDDRVVVAAPQLERDLAGDARC